LKIFERFFRPYYRCGECHLVFSTQLVLDTGYFYKEWMGTGRERIFAEVLSQLGTAKKGRLLDVGCGGGLLLSMAGKEGWEICGVEPSICESRRMHDGVREKVTKDMSELNPDCFDVVVGVNVIDQVKEVWNFLSEMSGHLKAGGTMVVRIPNGFLHRWILRSAELAPGKISGKLQNLAVMHNYGLERKVIMRMFFDAGLKNVRILPSAPSTGDIYGHGSAAVWLKRFIVLMNWVLVRASLGRLVMTPSILIVASKS